MKTVLIVEDDPAISDLIAEVLTTGGIQPIRAYSGSEALLVLQRRHPDLILLDLMLPGISGEAVMERVPDIPVIIVSARGEIDDKVDLLRSGAADYITKPFDTRELLARIEVQLRPAAGRRSPDLTCGPLTLSPLLQQVSAGGQTVKLTRTETAILKLLMRNSGQVITKSEMLEQISEDTPDGMENSLKVHISHLRAKLRNICDQEIIESVWGIGFKPALKS
ncbi:response regulator transcription factor [Holdemania filiformis]|uniref:DNA-binding response regulator n=1 Tax=Holdemania filiformis TaxID=61171 RepID=A0A412FLA0_9FIRM|nr:response regulator transcription factor [Holdemania filiformis]MBS5001710.1 response regulator transcription factor [Holdemania filiformis]RGR68945.1 DNA-binding response regulator [Holdemania filiformis]